MNKLAFASIRQLQAMRDKKDLTSSELLSFFLKRCATHDTDIKSVIECFEQQSIEKACTNEGRLRGIPGLIKDNICQKGRITSCASKMLSSFVSPYDATAIDRLKKQGAFLIGRANMDEFAMGSSTETSSIQRTKNPWDLSRVPGGSSGGSAAAVAAGLVPWALGSETGGSVRQPAAFCGLVGLKPTYGLVSRSGLIAYGSSLDQIGIFSRTVYDNAHILSAIAGHDEKDSTTRSVPAMDYTQFLKNDGKLGLKIGVIENAMKVEGFDKEVFSALEDSLAVFKKLGANIKYVSLPTMDYAAAVYFIVSRAEAASNLARYDGVRYGLRVPSDSLKHMYKNTRHDGFGEEVKARILIGNYVLSAGHAEAFYQNAQKVRRQMGKEFDAIFQEVDILFAPVHAQPAFKFGTFADNKLEMDLQDYFTCAMNLTGNPALAVPCGFTSQNLPIGFQLIGPDLSEGLLYSAAHSYEKETSWHTVHPKHFS